ncbi:MAG: peptidase [Ahrensia sp.]|nr:peptidase [Ahrensia sp.]
MTYCVGLKLDQGLLFMSDTRTNAGVDNISSAKKMFTWSVPGERVITLLMAGNLATTQAVASLLDERSKASEERDPSILHCPSMFQVAKLVGETLKEVIAGAAKGGQAADASFAGTILVGGQIKGGEPCLFLIYPEGNFVEATADTPFFQIGEMKYGRPILVRAFRRDMSFEEAIQLLLVSYDSTIKSNLAVDLPLDVQIYQRDGFNVSHEFRVEKDDAHYQQISQIWGNALKTALETLPPFKL